MRRLAHKRVQGFRYCLSRAFYVEAVAKLEEDSDDDQIFLIAVAKKWHPKWWWLKRKMQKLDQETLWRQGY